MPEPSFEQLMRMTGDRGGFVHTNRTERRVANGYCTDDSARLLVDATAAPVLRLVDVAVKFLTDAQSADG